MQSVEVAYSRRQRLVRRWSRFLSFCLLAVLLSGAPNSHLLWTELVPAALLACAPFYLLMLRLGMGVAWRSGPTPRHPDNPLLVSRRSSWPGWKVVLLGLFPGTWLVLGMIAHLFCWLTVQLFLDCGLPVETVGWWLLAWAAAALLEWGRQRSWNELDCVSRQWIHHESRDGFLFSSTPEGSSQVVAVGVERRGPNALVPVVYLESGHAVRLTGRAMAAKKAEAEVETLARKLLVPAIPSHRCQHPQEVSLMIYSGEFQRTLSDWKATTAPVSVSDLPPVD